MSRSPLVVALALLALLPAVPAAQAGSSTTPTSCVFNGLSFAFSADIPVVLEGTAEVLDSADGRYVDATEVVPGQQLRVTGATLSADLPQSLAQLGFENGNFVAGPNSIQARVWVNVQATNTVEGTQLLGPFDVTASTVITTDAQGNFASATPFSFADPVLPDTTWTATGGPVDLRHAPAGSITQQLPIGPPTGGNGPPAPRPVAGSTVIFIPQLGAARLTLDCSPPGALPPFDTVAGPRNQTCLSSLGRQLSGAPAGTPPGVTRELDPLTVALSRTTPAGQYTPGEPYTLTGARVSVTLPADVVAALAEREYAPGEPAFGDGETYASSITVALRATNTAEGTRQVRVDLPSRFERVAGVWQPAVLEGALPDTTWTPTGSARIAFAQAGPAALGALLQPGVSSPTLSAAPFSALPHGSLYVRLGSERLGETLDCLPAAITAVDDGTPWSDLGREASGARYTVATSADGAPAFSSVTAVVPPEPEPEPEPTAPPSDPTPAPPADPAPQPTPAPPVATPAPPTPTPAAPAVRRGTPTIRTSTLKAVRDRVKLQIRCSTTGVCTGRVALRSTGRVRVGSRSKVVTVAATRSYRVAAGRTATLSIPLSRDARTALRRTRRFSVRVTLTPTGRKAVRRTVKLTR